MKHKLAALVISCLFYQITIGQGFRLNAYSAYVFDDAIDAYYSTSEYYNGTIKGGFRWGAGLEYMLHEVYGVSLSYTRQDTHAPMTYYDNGAKDKTFDLGVNWILLGVTRYLKKKNLEPYLGFRGGVAAFKIKNPSSGSNGSGTKLAWALDLGTNIYFSENVGIKLQVDIRSAVQAVGGGFYFGTGGAGAGLSNYSTIYQFALGGGLVFRFPHKETTSTPQSTY